MSIQAAPVSHRQPAFDALKFMAIFLVLWGHVVQYGLSSTPADNVVYRTIYAFHMPLFMLVSGYFAASAIKQEPRKFLRHKFRQLLLPPLTWGLLLYLLLKGGQAVLQGDRSASLTDMCSYLFHNLWFLKSCFLCFLLAYLTYRVGKARPWAIGLSLVCSQCVPWFQLSVMYPCFIAGLELRRHPSWQTWVRENRWWLGGALLPMLLFWSKDCLAHWSLLPAGGGISDCILDSSALLQPYRIATGIVGSLFFVGLFLQLFREEPKRRPIKWCCAFGQLTLGIYVVQNILVETLMPRVVSFDSLPLQLFNFVVAPAVSMAALVACVVVIRLISRSAVCAFLFFGKALPKA